MSELPLGEPVTFRQRLWFDSYRFQFNGTNSNDGQIRIRRHTDDKYWNGASWVDNETWNSTTTDVTAREHTYDLDTTGLRGVVLTVTMRVNEDEDTHKTEEYRVKRGASAEISFDG